MRQGKTLQTGKTGYLFSACDSAWSCKNTNVLKRLHEVLSNHKFCKVSRGNMENVPSPSLPWPNIPFPVRPYISWWGIWVWPVHWPSITALCSKTQSWHRAKLCDLTLTLCGETRLQQAANFHSNSPATSNKTKQIPIINDTVLKWCLYFTTYFCLRHLFFTMFLLFL